jgi:circadian clock protein KaiB
VAGATPRSIQAIGAVRAVCEGHLAGRYDLEVVDIY